MHKDTSCTTATRATKSKLRKKKVIGYSLCLMVLVTKILIPKKFNKRKLTLNSNNPTKMSKSNKLFWFKVDHHPLDMFAQTKLETTSMSNLKKKLPLSTRKTSVPLTIDVFIVKKPTSLPPPTNDTPVNNISRDEEEDSSPSTSSTSSQQPNCHVSLSQAFTYSYFRKHQIL